jgi:hypothetical protein
MKKVTIFILSLLVLAGCSSAPLKKDTNLALYDTAIVKNIQIDYKTLSNNNDGEWVAEFKQSEPEFAKVYNDNLKTALENAAMFTRTTSDDKILPNSVIIESRTAIIYAGIRAITPTMTVVNVMVKDGATKNLLCSYNVESHSGRQIWKPIMGALKNDFSSLGEQAVYEMLGGCLSFAKTVKEFTDKVKATTGNI